ncbi:MFS transporter [Lentzea flaviverrucosa]|uniref:Predicted arabinose efflux permease, MFS family n=1 Tax=Lentzea flaviverrucosa TaxID=200379 RepID=A0A1H9XXD8_9PSEU|nr:MFS transporter [Lentzea flaviverrucosa]RDI17073.1 putative MFS family arabinose efflux permease [Lentzea flaviverrucosa]SES50855.1 Predicted arabinose efflux permease, MFS family [Lentzea flaviverrucosa]
MTALLDRTGTAVRRPFLSRGVGFAGISAAMVAILVAAGAPTPLLPIYQHQWGFAPWVLTLAFGIYAFSLLVSILVIGSLSDYVGRRPLMIAALAIDLVAMVMFLFAPSIGWVIAARVVQGVATGAASSALSAAVVELAPERFKKLGAQMTSMAPLGGLAIGALFAGLLAEFASDATFEVWLVLAVVMAAGTIFAVFTPETATRKPGAVASLNPRISLPVQVRRLYWTSVPGIVGGFMTMTAFMGLVPALLVAVFAVQSPIVGSLLAFVALGASTVASAFSSGVKAPRLRLGGTIAMVAGAVLFIGSIGATSLPLLWAAAIVGGGGIGASFAGTTRGLVPEVAPHERAGLFTAIFFVGYLAMGSSAIIAGLFVGVVGAATMAIGYGIAVAIVTLVSVVAVVRVNRG